MAAITRKTLTLQDLEDMDPQKIEKSLQPLFRELQSQENSQMVNHNVRSINETFAVCHKKGVDADRSMFALFAKILKKEDATVVLYKNIEAGNTESALILLDRDLYINNTNPSLLALASKMGMLPVVRKLLEKGANKRDVLAMQLACEYKRFDVVNVLMKELEIKKPTKVALEVGRPCEYSFLCWAAYHGREDVLTLLIEFDPDLVNNEWSCTHPLYVAIEAKQQEMAIRLIGNSVGALMYLEADLDSYFNDAFLLAAKHGLTRVVEHLIAKGVKVGYTNNGRETALRLASQGGHLETVRTLVVTHSVPIQPEAMLLALQFGYLSVFDFLLWKLPEDQWGTPHPINSLLKAQKYGYTHKLLQAHPKFWEAIEKTNEILSSVIESSYAPIIEAFCEHIPDWLANVNNCLFYARSQMTARFLRKQGATFSFEKKDLNSLMIGQQYPVLELYLEEGGSFELKPEDLPWKKILVFREEISKRLPRLVIYPHLLLAVLELEFEDAIDKAIFLQVVIKIASEFGLSDLLPWIKEKMKTDSLKGSDVCKEPEKIAANAIGLGFLDFLKQFISDECWGYTEEMKKWGMGKAILHGYNEMATFLGCSYDLQIEVMETVDCVTIDKLYSHLFNLENPEPIFAKEAQIAINVAIHQLKNPVLSIHDIIDNLSLRARRMAIVSRHRDAHEYVNERYGDSDNEMPEYSDFANHVKSKKIYGTIDGEEILLNELGPSNWTVIGHDKVAQILEHIEKLAQEMREGKGVHTDEILWWFVHDQPFGRASDDIGQMLTRALCHHRGITPSPWKKGYYHPLLFKQYSELKH